MYQKTTCTPESGSEAPKTCDPPKNRKIGAPGKSLSKLMKCFFPRAGVHAVAQDVFWVKGAWWHGTKNFMALCSEQQKMIS